MRKSVAEKLVVLVCVCAAIASATPLTNGGFETCTGCGTLPPAAGYLNMTTGSTQLTGWSIIAGNIDWVYKTFWSPVGGDYSIDLNGTSTGAIQTTLSVTPGEAVSISWYGGMDPDAYLIGGKDYVVGSVRIYDSGSGGAQTLDQYFSYKIYYVPGATDAIWQFFSSGFVTPTSNQISIAFYSQEPQATAPQSWYGPLLDNVEYDLGGVPEPGTFSLFAGAGLVGLALFKIKMKKQK